MKRLLLYLVMVLFSIFISCELKTDEDNGGTVTPTDETISVTAPTTGDSLIVAESFDITWTSNSTQNINIDYTIDNGTTWYSITSNYDNLGSFKWSPIPNTVSDRCKVRIYTVDSAAVDLSDGFFSIVPKPAKKITVVTPNGGERLFVGESYNIKWTSASVDDIRIDFSFDNGVQWNSVVENFPADSAKYTWSPIPNTESNLCLIRITDIAADSISDLSNSVFTITVPKEIKVTSPNGGEKWNANSTQTITWFSSEVENVKIEFTTNNGVSWSTIVENTPSDGYYTWGPIPNNPSENAKIKITNIDSGYPSDESDAVFTIEPELIITITSPNGGESWLSSSSQYIRWTTGVPVPPAKSIFGEKESSKTQRKKVTGKSINNPNSSIKSGITQTNSKGLGDVIQSIDNVKIEYSTNNGSSWNLIATDIPNTGTYLWNSIPIHNSSLCIVRISDVEDGVPFDISDASFTIFTDLPQEIIVTSPDGGESWPAGTSQDITWNSTGIESVKIEYTTNNGVSWVDIVNSTLSDGFYTWSQVPSTASTNCRVKISDAFDGTPYDESNGFFTIAPEPSIVVTSPNGGEIWQVGTRYNITWTSENVSYVKIEFTTNGGALWNTISNSTPSDGNYTWEITDTDINSSLCKIKISDADDAVPYDVSDNYFSISNEIEQDIQLIRPNGGEVWNGGTTENITWTATGVTNVNIEYTTNNGRDWNLIVENLESAGAYQWTLPNVISTQCKIKIYDAIDNLPTVQSNSTFTIEPVPEITVLEPNGGEVWEAGVPDTIKWYAVSVNYVRIDYSTNNGLTWIELVQKTVNDGEYIVGFSVPSTEYKLSIAESTTGSPVDESDGVFTVSPQTKLVIIEPNGGERWRSGSSQYIQWTTSSGGGFKPIIGGKENTQDVGGDKLQSVTEVKIEFTTNGGATWSTITNSTINNGIYLWENIPSLNSNICKVRISDAADGIPTDLSDEPFAIYSDDLQMVTVTSPNGGETWQAGTNQTITWISQEIVNVDIDYTTDNGVNWNPVAANTPSDGFYSWDVPNTASTNCRIRISDALDGSPSDLSNEVFTIDPEPEITLLQPNGGEVLVSGTSTSINWTSTNIQNVKLEYTTNNGAQWDVIIASTPSDGQYTWANIPVVVSDLCRLRISDADDGVPFDISDDNFQITNENVQEITVVQPNGGESWQAGTNQTITWTSKEIANVNIEYTTNNGVNWNPVVANTPSDGFYSWDVPNTASTNCKIKISDALDGSPSDLSNGVFTIDPEPEIRIIQPNGGEILVSGTSTSIKWTSTNIQNVKIEYTTNNGADWNLIIASTPSNGQYTWANVPSVVSELCRIRISDASDGVPFDLSDDNFQITDGTIEEITVVQPNGGEVWNAGTTQEIKWTAIGVSNVKIEYTTNNGISWTIITGNTPSDGYYTWEQVPSLASTNCRIRISDTADGSPVDISDELFTIAPEPGITVTSPNGGESYLNGTSTTITWTSENVANVKIEFTTNGGATWTTIIASTPSNGFYLWSNIPNLNSALCQVRISDAEDGTPYDISDSYFTITNQVNQTLTVTIPNGGEQWEAGTTQNILWQASGISNVDVEFTTNNGLTWQVIGTNLPNSGATEWAIPLNLNSPQCKVRVSDADDGIPADESNSTFTVKPAQSITVTAPTGGQVFQAGEPITISWNATGIENVGIRYTTTNGLGSINEPQFYTVTESTPNNGTYVTSFSIPSSEYYIEVYDALDGSPRSRTIGNFTILPQQTNSIIVTSPNGGETLLYNDPLMYDRKHEIRWLSTGVEFVNIEYSTNGGATWMTIVNDYSSIGTYSWTVPDIGSRSDNCLIRITSSSSVSIYDVSDNQFSILPSTEFIRVVTPNGGEEWDYNVAQVLEWESSGNVSKVDIYLSYDNGNSWEVVIRDYPSYGAYEWDPPNVVTSLGRIMVTVAGDNTIGDVSDGTFKLINTIVPLDPFILFVSPLKDYVWTIGANENICWRNSPDIVQVNIDYSLDNGVSWTNITTNYFETPWNDENCFTWTVVGPATTVARIRIQGLDALGIQILERISEPFTIQ